METDYLEQKIFKKIHKICPEARSCYHHLFASEGGGWIIHGKFSLPINEVKFLDRLDALKDALNILKGKV